MASWYNNHYTNAAKFYNHRLVEHPRLTILSVRTKLNCDTILSSKTTTIFIILYPWKNSNPHQQIRSLVCCPLHHKGIWSRVVESDHSNWFCRPGPNRSVNPTLLLLPCKWINFIKKFWIIFFYIPSYISFKFNTIIIKIFLNLFNPSK